MNYKDSSIEATASFCKAFDCLDEIHAMARIVFDRADSPRQKTSSRRIMKKAHELSQHLVDFRVYSTNKKPAPETRQ